MHGNDPGRYEKLSPAPVKPTVREALLRELIMRLGMAGAPIKNGARSHAAYFLQCSSSSTRLLIYANAKASLCRVAVATRYDIKIESTHIYINCHQAHS